MPDHQTVPEQAALAWLTRQHSGRWNTADEQAHATWLAADPSHALAWEEARAMWEQLADLRPLATAELRAARRTRSAPNRFAGFALAGICALAIGLLPVLLPGSIDATKTIQTARGEQRTLTLADGSTIELNTASRVEIDFGPFCRCLRLISGEAVFRVAHGDPRAFKVKVDGGTVRDIGTEFWIRREAQRVAVAVIEGAIEMSPGLAAPFMQMEAGERQAFDQRGLLADAALPSLNDLTAWRDGSIVFRDAPLPEVLAEFARYHPVDIQMDSRLKNYRLSGRFASADLDRLLKLIQAAYPVLVERPAPERLVLKVLSIG